MDRIYDLNKKAGQLGLTTAPCALHIVMDINGCIDIPKKDLWKVHMKNINTGCHVNN